ILSHGGKGRREGENPPNQPANSRWKRVHGDDQPVSLTSLRPMAVIGPDCVNKGSRAVLGQANLCFGPSPLLVNRHSSFGQISDKASAIRPGPKAIAAAPCSQTAALEAAKAGMPWARSPSTMPASTSPVPAVARNGLVVALIEASPNEAATT